MNITRASGILLHPTSLPCTAGIGTMGKHAFAFIDWLAQAKQTLWQILPIGPTGYGDSPYASFSTFAGNPLLIDIDELANNGLLNSEEKTEPHWIRRTGLIDFGSVVWWKLPLLKKAAENYEYRSLNEKSEYSKKSYENFIQTESYWLDEYALFMSIKEFYDAKARDEKQSGAMWNNYWPKGLASHNTKDCEEWKAEHYKEIDIHKIIQFFFFTQWKKLKQYANEKGVSIIGDIPIFVASDSADVWANQHLFQLAPDGKPLSVAGVPPDYFSSTGQLWGNPLYNWTTMKKDGYTWWINRIKAMLNIVDHVRIDHFRGFESYWAIPYPSENAITGEWKKGPGNALFKAIKKELGTIPIIAEDLGIITKEVEKLRDEFNLPGMKVLQFAFNTEEEKNGALINAFLPHTYTSNCVVYPGTHDNDTALGWYTSLKKEDQNLVASYLHGDITECEFTSKTLPALLIKEAFSSVARYAVIPFQDLYGLGKEGRMNEPSTTGSTNWQWRMSEEMLYGNDAQKKAEWINRLSVLYNRNNQYE